MQPTFANPSLTTSGQSLGIKTEIMDPLGPANVFSTSVPPPLSMAERMPYTATLGLALSDNARTPNLLFTFKERQEQAAVTRINRGIFSLFMSVVLFLGGFLIYQEYLSRQKHAEISTLQLELAQYSPAVDQNLVMQTAAKVKNQQQILKRKASEYLGIAVLSELSALTPANIRLLSITADLGGIPEAQSKETKSGQQSKVDLQESGVGWNRARRESEPGIIVGALFIETWIVANVHQPHHPLEQL